MTAAEMEYECSDCGASVSSSDRRCPQCGVDFNLPEGTGHDAGTPAGNSLTFRCADCGAEVERGNTLCQRCTDRLATGTGIENSPGESLDIVSSGPAPEITTGLHFLECPNCGVILKSRPLQCPECGVDFESVDTDLTGPPVAQEKPDPLFALSDRPPFHSLRSAGKRLSWTLTICVVLNIFAIIASFVYVQNAVGEQGRGITPPVSLQISFTRILRISEIQAAVYSIALVLFLSFVYQAHLNLSALGVAGMKDTAVSAVAMLLIPAFNILQSYRLFPEIWRASDPVVSGGSSWKYSSVSPFIAWWWGSCLVSSVLAAASLLYFMRGKLSEADPALGWILAAANGTFLVAAILTNRFTTRMDSRLEQKKHSVLLAGEVPVRESVTTETESIIPIPVGGWIFYKLLKTLETTHDETQSLRRRLKGFLWIFGGMAVAVTSYLLDNTGIVIFAVMGIIYGILLMISGTIGRHDPPRTTGRL